MPETYDLTRLALPEGCDVNRLVEKCPNVACVRFSDGEYLVREGEASDDIYLVLRGSYVVEHPSADADNQPAATLGLESIEVEDPAFIGEMAYFGQAPRTASVRSSGSTHTLQLKPAHLDVIIAEFPFFTRVLCRKFTERLREANQLLDKFQKRTVIAARQITKAPGEQVFKQGEPADTLYQLVDGVLVREKGGSEETVQRDRQMMGFVDPGPYFKESAYEATVKAKTQAMLVAIPASSKQAVVRNYPEILLRLYAHETG